MYFSKTRLASVMDHIKILCGCCTVKWQQWMSLSFAFVIEMIFTTYIFQNRYIKIYNLSNKTFIIILHPHLVLSTLDMYFHED